MSEEAKKDILRYSNEQDVFVKMASVAFAANILPHRNQAPKEVAKQCFQNAHIWWEELQEYRRTHGND